MKNAVFVLVGVLVFPVTAVLAQQKPTIEKGVIQYTSPTDGKGMFQAYCAACHGTAGKGDGPAVPALAKAPADLTRISARNSGKFPDVRVARFIEGLDEVPAHGSRDMPIWGPLFRSFNVTDQSQVKVRVSTLVDYLKTLQQ
jgi:mono/diheme cytochrome c family protein